METADHIFFQCPYAQQVWRQVGITISSLHNPHIPIEDKLLTLLRLSNDTAILRKIRLQPVWLLWRLWKSRNELLFNSKVIAPEILFNLVVSDVNEWISYNQDYNDTQERQRSRVTQANKSQWKKPPSGWVKCNYDVSHRTGNNSSGMGWIIRSRNGSFLNCGHGAFEGRSTVIESEATALVWAMQACLALGYRNVIFEGDNLILHSVLAHMEDNIKLQVLKSTIMGLRQNFVRTRFEHCKREANGSADKLSKYSISCNHLWGVYHTCPFFLQHFVILDNE